MSPPFSTFSDPKFKDMLKPIIPNMPGYMKVKNVPILNRQKLIKYIELEWLLFCEFFCEMLEPLVKKSGGCSFVFLLHDAVTLANKLKFLSVGLQFIDADWNSNHVIAISFGKIVSSATSHIAPHLKNVVHDVTSYDFEKIICTAMQDCGALKVAQVLDLDEEKCMMHQGDKIGKSCVGELVRTKNQQIVNAFPEWQALLKKYRDQTKYMTSSITNRTKYDTFKLNNPDISDKLLVLDDNKTRVTSIHELIGSNLFMKIPMSKFLLEDNVPPF